LAPGRAPGNIPAADIIENMMGTIRSVCRNVKYWGSASMALRWTAAATQQLPALRTAHAAHRAKLSNNSSNGVVDQQFKVA
jgi:hypothetical protein